ncbi:MAG: thioredoxin domain-containing protein [Rhodospirillaceae bacterium]|nr:thioredoxin domain-containing protein [Rhodospirillaceae bacterium]
MPENELQHETSPYLLQHKDNPVHWMAWGDAAFARAKAENKPILLSVGYAACHWCHVMAHESFEDDEISAVMNDLVINIKVDREERPDIDTIYQSALAMIGEQGGWPLTMFLTPDGEPFWGGTYFPPTPRYGRPGFPDVVKAVAETFKADPDRVQKNVEALREGLAQNSTPMPGEEISPEIIQQVAQRLTNEIDMFRGGIKGAPKFPQTGIFEQIWRAWLRTDERLYHNAVVTSLNNICQGGIYDHLGGGFARYSVDEMWLAPHFEKMLYDNAELIHLLTLVYQETKSPLYAQRIDETVAWLEREMIEEGGGFASSLDADSEGEEGKFYVWNEAEVDALLGEKSSDFKRVYNVDADGNWEGKTILNRLHSMELLDDATEAEMAAGRKILLDARAHRIRPGKDTKVLADWNGLMIAALAFASHVFDRPKWRELAQQAYDFVGTAMRPNGRLLHSWCAGEARHPATLDDHANLARAALALYECTGEDRYRQDAESFVDEIEQHYKDENGAYFFAANDTPNLITRTKTVSDNATPSGNGTLVGVLARLYYLTGAERYRALADNIVRTFAGEPTRNFFPLSTLINSSELLRRGQQIVIIGDRDDAETQSLVDCVHIRSLPDRILNIVATLDDLPAGHPAEGKEKLEARATAYVCEGPVCSLPVNTAADLTALLDGAP